MLAIAMAAAPAFAQDTACGSESVSGERVALLVANDSFVSPRWRPLLNPGRDVEAVCRAFEAIGISVRILRDKNAEELRTAIDQFYVEAAEAEAVLLYFAGHGFEFAGRNYFVPRDAPASASAAMLSQQFLSLEEVALTAGSPGAFRIIFVDACRTTDPIVRISEADPVTNPIMAVGGTLGIDEGAIFFSTAKGRPALDQAPLGSPTSPFAAAIVRYVGRQGTEISELFNYVGRDVRDVTTGLENGPQYPFRGGFWVDQFYFTPRPVVTFVAPTPVPTPAPLPPAPVARPAPVVTPPSPPIDGRGAAATDRNRAEMAARMAAHRAQQEAAAAQARSPAAGQAEQRARYEAELAARSAAAEEASRIARPAMRGAGPPAAFDPNTAPASRLLLPQPLDLPMARLAVEDEPILVGLLLLERSAQEIAFLAQNGDRAAQHILGYMLHYGVGVERDLVSARAALEASAATGYAPAQLELGYFLLSQQPGAADIARAEQLYRAAASAGYAKAKTHLADRIDRGQFAAQSPGEARRLYIEAADGGHPAAMFALTRDAELRDAMMARLRGLATAGNPEGNYWICEAEFYAHRAGAAMNDCLLAARASFTGAMTIVARTFADGSGIAANPREARYWARLARAQPKLDDDFLSRIADIPSS